MSHGLPRGYCGSPAPRPRPPDPRPPAAPGADPGAPRPEARAAFADIMAGGGGVLGWLTHQVDRLLGIHDRDEDEDAAPAPLERAKTMSTKNDLLRQIRDQMNPNQGVQNKLLILQGVVSIAGSFALLAAAIGIIVQLGQVNDIAGGINGEMATTLALAEDMAAGVNQSTAYVESLAVIPDMIASMQNMVVNMNVTANLMVAFTSIFGGR